MHCLHHTISPFRDPETIILKCPEASLSSPHSFAYPHVLARRISLTPSTPQTLTHVFHFTTHRVKIRSRIAASPALFLQSLLLPKGGGPGRWSRSGSNLKPPLSPNYHRSISFPNELTHARSQSPEPLPGIETRAFSSPRLQHSLTDPVPTHNVLDVQELPSALILTGLDKATSAVQQALSAAIAERQIILGEDGGGVHRFPDGFIAVYVCPIHSTERPRVHKSLVSGISHEMPLSYRISQLDKFAMSHNILASQSSRQSLRSMPFSPMHSLSQAPSFSHSNPGSPTTSYSMSLPQPQTPPYFPKPLPSAQPGRHLSTSKPPPPPMFTQEPFPKSFIESLQKHCRKTHWTPELGLYLSDLFSAARHHNRLDGMLLTAKARKDAEDLARAARVIGSDLTGMELIRPDTKDDDDSEYFDAQSDTRYLRNLDESSTTNLLRKDSMFGGSTSKISTMALNGEGEDIAVLDVTEVDVARTMPRVVSHRLSLRSGPEDEVLASAVIGATFGGLCGATNNSDGAGTAKEGDMMQKFEKGYGGLTLKDVLVDILNKV